ncbi:MAG: tetratricopeptide repeat protein, partial [Campylobacterales bacterium]|nr:tetratricopeptide repeat protein [Campylobacterales bacterium]
MNIVELEKELLYLEKIVNIDKVYNYFRLISTRKVNNSIHLENMINFSNFSKLNVNYVNVGKYYIVHDSNKALHYLEKARAMNVELSKFNPKDREYGLAVVNHLIGTVYGVLGKTNESIKKSLEAQKIFEKMYSDNPTLPDLQHNLAACSHGLGDSYQRIGNKEAIKYYQ